MQRLTELEQQAALDRAPGWRLEVGKLTRGYEFTTFVEAISFVNTVAEMAESAGHHPDIDIRYNRVSLVLVTHDANGITALDAEMAAALSERFPME